jgi:hypothetical protein
MPEGVISAIGGHAHGRWVAHEKKKRRVLLDVTEPAPSRELFKRCLSCDTPPQNKRRGGRHRRVARRLRTSRNRATRRLGRRMPRAPRKEEPAASEEAFAAAVASVAHLSLWRNATEKAAPNKAEQIYLALRLRIAFERELGSRAALIFLASSAREVSSMRAENPSIFDRLTSQLGPLQPLDAAAVTDVLGRRDDRRRLTQ